MTIDLNPHHLDTVRAILAAHVPDCEVMAFGSRAAWTARERSDLDLAVSCAERAPAGAIARLREAFEDSDLPIRVDILDWHAVADSFRETIAPDCVVIQQGERAGWREVTLGEVATITKGLSYQSAHLNVGGPDLIGLGQFVPGGGAKMDDGRTYAGEYRDKDVARVGELLIALTDITQRGDVLGSPLMVPSSVGEFCLYTLDAGKLHLDERIDPLFAYHALRSHDFRAFAAAYATGTTVRRIHPIDVLAYKFALPPLDEQRRIARVLGALDERIEASRREAATLEEMARALFRHWFVDFGPVRAKAAGLPSGLPPGLDALFPASFEVSAPGEAPAGWGWASVDDAFDVTMGQSPPSETYNEDGDGLPFYQGRADFGSRFPGRRVYCSAPARLAEPGDVLVTVRAPVGDVNMALERCCVGRGVAAVRHRGGSRSYAYYAMQSLRNAFDAFEADGTVFGSIGKRGIRSLPWVLPPGGVVAQFEASCSPLDSRIEGAERESRTLATLRDTLLPQLLSREVRVPEAATVPAGDR